MNTKNVAETMRGGMKGIVLGAVVLMTMLSQGCFLVAVGAAGAAGAGAVAYVRGELAATLSNRLDPVVTATNQAVAQLQFAKVSERKDAFSAVIVARTALDKKIEITITKTGDTVTGVKIRVGTFGDETLSRAVLDKIKANL